MPAQVTSFSSMVDETASVDGTSINATYLNGITSAINHLERLIWSDSETVPTETDLLFNATYDNTNWNRIDTNKAASRIRLDQYGGIIGERVASGANPITWADGRFPFEGYTKNLMIRTASATTLAVSWDRIALKHKTSGVYRVFPSGSVTITITNTGANGIDTGAMAASTLYYINVIAKDDETLAACVTLASGTLHSQTFPTDYNWAWGVSWFYSNGSSQINPISQHGNLWKLEEGITAGIMRPVNASIPNSANWQTANCGTWVPAGFGRMFVSVEGFLNSAAGDNRYLSVGDGGSILGNGVNGHVVAVRTATDSVFPGLQEGWALTDGTANQQIRWKINAADAGAAATLNILKAKVPTLMG